ncbi:MAG: hypothetical protein GAK35_03601 [Herbaspirillum frisingense]|uniref:Choice-of-anchor A domain-containing protein n=1 Tax=Herbaspirillum frisingense TaxID=92645 RepID=A0A7V8FTX1_9BURK|nr:MAG: hypothetical protein GAK35_03601 [Herbaspirillum frisingense]
MSGRHKSLLAAVAAFLSLSFAGHAMATTSLSAAQVLTQFNLVVLGDATSGSHVDGRAWVGGSLTGGDFVQHAGDAAASNYAGLTVMGSISNVHVNGLGAVIGGSVTNSTVNSGSSYIGGSVSGSNLNGPAYVSGGSSGSNFNGGLNASPSALMQTNQQAASSTNFASTLNGLSGQLKGLSGSSTISFSGGKASFNAVADASGVAVFNLDSGMSQQVFSAGEFSFTTNGASTIVINSSIASATIAANFLGGQAQSLGKTLIWNFYNASSLTINSQFGGSILATNAALTLNQNIEGGVYVKSLAQNGEIHLQAFNGNLPAVAVVPEPQAYLSMLAGLLMIGGLLVVRKRKARERHIADAAGVLA